MITITFQAYDQYGNQHSVTITGDQIEDTMTATGAAKLALAAKGWGSTQPQPQADGLNPGEEYRKITHYVAVEYEGDNNRGLWGYFDHPQWPHIALKLYQEKFDELPFVPDLNGHLQPSMSNLEREYGMKKGLIKPCPVAFKALVGLKPKSGKQTYDPRPFLKVVAVYDENDNEVPWRKGDPKLTQPPAAQPGQTEPVAPPPTYSENKSGKPVSPHQFARDAMKEASLPVLDDRDFTPPAEEEPESSCVAYYAAITAALGGKTKVGPDIEYMAQYFALTNSNLTFTQPRKLPQATIDALTTYFTDTPEKAVAEYRLYWPFIGQALLLIGTNDLDAFTTYMAQRYIKKAALPLPHDATIFNLPAPHLANLAAAVSGEFKQTFKADFKRDIKHEQ